MGFPEYEKRVVLDYDNRAIYWTLKDSYRSPVLDLPYHQIGRYLKKQSRAYGRMTKDILAGEMLTEEEFIASIKLSFDEKVAKIRGHSEYDRRERPS